MKSNLSNVSIREELKKISVSLIENTIIKKMQKDKQNSEKTKMLYELHIVKINDLIDIYNNNLKDIITSKNNKAISQYEEAYFLISKILQGDYTDIVFDINHIQSLINQSLILINRKK